MTMALEWGEGPLSRPGRTLPPAKTQYPLYRRLDGSQGQSGQVQKISPPLGFDPQAIQSLYRLRYPAHTCWMAVYKLLTVVIVPVKEPLV